MMTDISYSSPRNNSVGNFLHGTLIWSVIVVTTSFVRDYSLPLLMSVVCVPDMRIFMFGYNLAPPVTQYLLMENYSTITNCNVKKLPEM